MLETYSTEEIAKASQTIKLAIEELCAEEGEENCGIYYVCRPSEIEVIEGELAGEKDYASSTCRSIADKIFTRALEIYEKLN